MHRTADTQVVIYSQGAARPVMRGVGRLFTLMLNSMGQARRFELEAKTVTAERAEFCWLVGFAGDPIDTTEYLLLERGVGDDEQDIRLGMATYHVEINGQGASCYGGVSTIDLQPGRLILTFAPKGAARLGCDQASITFDLSPDGLYNLKEILRHVFAGSDVRTTGLE